MSQGFAVTNIIPDADNVKVTDDTTTNATMYPVWVSSTSGYLPAKITSSKYSFNPSTGRLTLTSIGFNPTTGGIAGTTTNDDATAGYVGEIISSTILSGSAVSFVTNTAKDVTSISLTAGDWDVFGNIFFIVGTSSTAQAAWCSLTSATTPNAALRNAITMSAATIAPPGNGLNTPYLRVSVNTTTTVYLSGLIVFGAGACTGCGGIFARRVR